MCSFFLCIYIESLLGWKEERPSRSVTIHGAVGKWFLACDHPVVVFWRIRVIKHFSSQESWNRREGGVQLNSATWSATTTSQTPVGGLFHLTLHSYWHQIDTIPGTWVLIHKASRNHILVSIVPLPWLIVQWTWCMMHDSIIYIGFVLLRLQMIYYHEGILSAVHWRRDFINISSQTSKVQQGPTDSDCIQINL